MSRRYIPEHFPDIKKHAGVIEKRADDGWCTVESVLADNARYLEGCRRYGCPYIRIGDVYRPEDGLLEG